jgi:Helix-turn-helix domain
MRELWQQPEYRKVHLAQLQSISRDPAVVAKRSSMGKHRERVWQAEERAILQRMAGRASSGDIAEEINRWRALHSLRPRTVMAVMTYAERQQIPLERFGDAVVSVEEARLLLGYSRHGIETLIRKGWLAPRPFGQHRMFWMEDLEAYLRERPWAVRKERMRLGKLRRLIESLTVRRPYLTVDEIARMIGACQTRVSAYAQHGRIEAYRLPWKQAPWQIPASEIPRVRELYMRGTERCTRREELAA